MIFNKLGPYVNKETKTTKEGARYNIELNILNYNNKFKRIRFMIFRGNIRGNIVSVYFEQKMMITNWKSVI